MRVISYKHIAPKTAWCNRCGAELEYTRSDVKHRINIDRFLVSCPLCANSITVPAPVHWQQESPAWMKEVKE